MGFDVWVARNDRSRGVPGHQLAELPRLKSELPWPFDDATNRTIELIDVRWLKGHAIVAAFEIESTTSIYSGLLRMSDAIAMQPNLNIPLYLVAPDERREKVLVDMNSPTFSRLSPLLPEVCRYIAFSARRERLSHVAPFVHDLKPDVLDDLSESCVIEEAYSREGAPAVLPSLGAISMPKPTLWCRSVGRSPEGSPAQSLHPSPPGHSLRVRPTIHPAAGIPKRPMAQLSSALYD